MSSPLQAQKVTAALSKSQMVPYKHTPTKRHIQSHKYTHDIMDDFMELRTGVHMWGSPSRQL